MTTEGPFIVKLVSQGFAVVNSDNGAVLWLGAQRFKARQIAEDRNREYACFAKLAEGLDADPTIRRIA